MDWAEQHGSQLHHIPVEAPWKSGLAERAGGSLKWVREKLNSQFSATPASEMGALLAIATKATNGDINESGYSASQWVLGRQTVVRGRAKPPASLPAPRAVEGRRVRGVRQQAGDARDGEDGARASALQSTTSPRRAGARQGVAVAARDEHR